MQRCIMQERDDWREDAAACGFAFHTIDGERYWDERHAYRFTLAQIEQDLEDPSNELMGLCYNAVERIISDNDLMRRLAIPANFFDAIRHSWENQERDLYGRFDFCYQGEGSAKLLEFNADTPTSLFEAAVFQWRWLEAMKAQEALPPEADQFNMLHEKLIAAFGVLGGESGVMHFASVSDSEEDFGTVSYLADCAKQAGLFPVMIDMAHIGIDPQDWFTDSYNERIETLFKLYPLEDMVREEFGRYLITTPTRIIEPLWKLVLSNKGLLPVLWQMYEGHPNLLAAYFDDDDKARRHLGKTYVKKPLLSREGANVSLIDERLEGGSLTIEGPYGDEGMIVQELCYLPRFDNDWTVIGSWIVAGEAVGIGIREDDTPITRNSSRFLPHFILD